MTQQNSVHEKVWATEVHKNIMEVRYQAKKQLFSGKSEFQKVEIFETEGFGRMLLLDGIVMLSERDEFVYHEMISHVPLFVHPEVKRVLVIGGGDGGTAREVIRHQSVEHCRMVEIDRMVVESCQKFIPRTAAAMDDPRVEVTVGDGAGFVSETDETYDLVLVDSTDPIGPSLPLFGEDFYQNVNRILSPQGIVVAQGESAYYYREHQEAIARIQSRIFKNVYVYNYSNMNYLTGFWSFVMGCKSDLCPLADFDPSRVSASGLTFKYYNPDIHRAAFALPEFQRQALSDYLGTFRI